MSSEAVHCSPIDWPKYNDRGYREAVDMITYILTAYLEERSCPENKNAAVMVLFHSLQKSSNDMSRNSSAYNEKWMQAPSSFNFEQEFNVNSLSIDVCLDVVSKFELEDKFMEVLLEEREFQLIKDLRDSLMRWTFSERSAVFATKCINVLLSADSVPMKKLLELQSLFLFHLDSLLERLPGSKYCHVLKRVKGIYTTMILRELSLTAHHDIESFQLLKSAFELVENEVKMLLNTHIANDYSGVLKRDISKNMQNISLMQGSRKTEVLECLCRDKSIVVESDDSIFRRIDVFKAGVFLIERISAKCRLKNNAEYAMGIEIDVLWSQIVNTLTSKQSESPAEVSAAFFDLHSLQVILKCHKYLELLDGWDSCDLDIIHKLPNFTKFAGPLVCSVEFLNNMFNQLASFYNEAVAAGEKQTLYDFLLSIVFAVGNNAEITTKKIVMNSCLRVFSLEKLSFFDKKCGGKNFIKELSLVINQISEHDSNNFHALAQLSLVYPFDTLCELIQRGCSSAPLSKLVLKFLEQMNPLLLLQREDSQQKEIFSIIISNLKMVERDRFKVVADFVGGIMKIKDTTDMEPVISHYDMLCHILSPCLEIHITEQSNTVPLLLLLSVFQLALEGIDADKTTGKAIEMIDMMLAILFCMIKILSNYSTKDFVDFFLLHYERQQLHLAICNTLMKIRSHSLTQSTKETIYKKILDEFHAMNWQYKFYFVELFYDAPCCIQFPIPSQILSFSPGYGNMQFYGVTVLNSDQGPSQIWDLVFRICVVNEPIAQHFADSILRASKARILDIILAAAKSLVESTNFGWLSVVSLIRALCQTDNCGLFSEISFDGFKFMTGVEKHFTYEKSIITHSFLIVQRTFSSENEDIVLVAKQKIEGNFIDSLLELKESEECNAVNCLIILFKFVSLLQKGVMNTENSMDSFILQILETINQKQLIKMNASKNEMWSQRLMNHKKHIASAN